MKKFILLLFGVIFMYTSNAQVKTRVLSQRENIKSYFPYHIENSVNFIEIKRPNIDSVYAEDDRLNRQLERFAIKVKTNITEKDGDFFENGNFVIWKLGIFADGATSLNFKFRNLQLPKNAEMILYSSDEKMMIGSISDINIREGQIMTSMLIGDKAIIEIIIPKESKTLLSLNIEFISYGIIEHASGNIDLRGFDDSAPCIRENNIICPEFSDWYDLGNGVARVLLDGEWLCSGSLVTNECNVDRPFFLSAFHCLDYDFDGELDLDEIASLNNWSFEFNYESPNCDPSSEPTSWDTYNGADFLAGWNPFVGTDFLLLEIIDPTHITNTPNTINPTASINDEEVACIQHPRGDLKKVALDDDGVSAGGNFWIVNQMDDGLMEHGSSGAPMFDFNFEIFGIHSHRSGGVVCNGEGSNDINFFSGRIDVSWNGNNTDDTSLEPWLGGGRPPDFDNYVNDNYPIDGPDIVCDNAHFCNNNSAAGNVHWTVSPQSAFYPPYDGSTSCAYVKVNQNYQGYATITFTSTYPYGNCSFEGSTQKQFWIGAPDFSLTGYQHLCLFDYGFASINPISPYTTGDIQWGFDGVISGFGQGLSAGYQSFSQPGLGWVWVSMTNICGITEKSLSVLVEDCNRGWWEGRMKISPIPTKDFINVKIEWLSGVQYKISGDYYIVDISSNKIVDKGIYSSDNFELDVSNLKNGVYLLKTVSSMHEILFSKFVVLK